MLSYRGDSVRCVNVVRYRYRLRPGATAMAALLAEWDRCRWVWNRAVERLNETGEWVRDNTLTDCRGEHDWLREGAVVAQQQMLRDFRAKRAKGKGRRKFKSATLPAEPELHQTWIRTQGSLFVSCRRPVPPGRVVAATARRAQQCARLPRQHWALVCQLRCAARRPGAAGLRSVDRHRLGGGAVATTTDPEYDLPHPEHGRRAAKELARRQRIMARRKPARGQRASNGYLGAKRVAAKLSKKVARQRQDTARKWATKVVANHGVLAVEDFKPKFLAKSRMARKSADGAIGTTKATLIEYAQRAGRKVVLVPPAYTTMTCSGCGARAKSRLLLSERVFVCESCGAIRNRDRNAARVILDRAGLNPAGAEAVRHSELLEVRVLAEPGIPTR